MAPPAAKAADTIHGGYRSSPTGSGLSDAFGQICLGRVASSLYRSFRTNMELDRPRLTKFEPISGQLSKRSPRAAMDDTPCITWPLALLLSGGRLRDPDGRAFPRSAPLEPVRPLAVRRLNAA